MARPDELAAELPAPRAGVAREVALTSPWRQEESFRAFYDRCAPGLRAYLARMSGNADIADDLLQEAFLRLLRSPRANLDEGAAIRYLYRIAINLLNDHWRRTRREARSMDQLERLDERRDEPADGPAMSQIFGQLRPRDRSLLWLAYVEGWGHREIALVLGLRERSIKVLLFRARRRLSALLRQRGWGPEGVA